MLRPEGWREPGDPHTGSPTAPGAQTLGAVSVPLTARPSVSSPHLGRLRWVKEPRFLLRAQSLGEKLREGPHPGERQGRLGLLQSYSGGKQRAFLPRAC